MNAAEGLERRDSEAQTLLHVCRNYPRHVSDAFVALLHRAHHQQGEQQGIIDFQALLEEAKRVRPPSDPSVSPVFA